MEETINPNERRVCGCTSWRLVDRVLVCTNCHPVESNEIPCPKCKHFRPPDFCEMLPWNDRSFDNPWDKYFAWHKNDCDNFVEAVIAKK